MTAVTGRAVIGGKDYPASAPLTLPPPALTPRPAQPAVFAYAGTTTGAAAWKTPGALAVVSGEYAAAQPWKDAAAAGATVLAYLDPFLWTANGLYHQMLYTASQFGPAVPAWPPGYQANSYGRLADFRPGGTLLAKLPAVLEKMAADMPHIAGFFADDTGSMSWYPGIPWASFPEQAAWRAGAVAVCQAFRQACDARGMIFVVNGTWTAGPLSSGGGWPDANSHGMALADGGCVEHHDGQVSFFGPYAASKQWAAQSPVTRGTAFNIAITKSAAGTAEYAASAGYAYVAQQTDYTVIPAPWGPFHPTGLYRDLLPGVRRSMGHRAGAVLCHDPGTPAPAPTIAPIKKTARG